MSLWSRFPTPKDATAVTLRTRLGVETGKAWSTWLLVEGEANVPFISDYNSTTNGHTAYPIVSDPENYGLSRLQLVNTAIQETTLTLGRQWTNLDDQRLIGSVGWRQNEQTFDGLRMVNRTIPGVTLDVSCVNQVNRIRVPDARPGAIVGTYHGDNLLANVAWRSPFGKLTAFGYSIDLNETPLPLRDSTQTLGLRFAGERPLAEIKLGHIFSLASQKNYASNPLSFRNDYYLGELTATYRQYSLGASLEILGGDGAKGFATPLGTLHKFQGWADKFLTTPVNGIRDAYVNANYLSQAVGPFDTIGLTLSWHKFDSARLSIDYGSELDLPLQAKYPRFTGMLKYADYSAAATTPLTQRDTSKLRVQVEFDW